MYAIRSSYERAARIGHALALTGLSDFAAAYPRQLSGGPRPDKRGDLPPGSRVLAPEGTGLLDGGAPILVGPLNGPLMEDFGQDLRFV